MSWASRENGFVKKKQKKSPVKLQAILSTPSGTRTLDPLIKSQLLYQLS